MKGIRLKDIAEALGVLAVVASVLFLAIQVRQAQQQVVSDTDASVLQSTLQLQSFVSEYADVWERGRLGELLPEPEATVFRNLVTAHNDVAFVDYNRTTRLGESDVASVILNDFAGFLYQNPGARREWQAREDGLIAYRSRLAPEQETFSFWRDAIVERLSALDSGT